MTLYLGRVRTSSEFRQRLRVVGCRFNWKKIYKWKKDWQI